MNLVLGGDLGKEIRHARPAGDAGDQPPRPFEDAFQHALRAAHLPQHVDVDRAIAPGAATGELHLHHPAVDGIGEQFLMSPAAATPPVATETASCREGGWPYVKIWVVSD